MFKSLISVAVLCLCIAPVRADIHEFTLENGLKLLVKEDHRAPVAVSQVWYKVGGSYESNGITGISHVLEHMMFQGTPAYPDGEFSRIIAENGGDENAFTSSDYTSYVQTLEKSRLPISFELEADRMRNLIIAEKEFLKEIEVVKEERRWRTEDDPQSMTYEIAMATAFQTSPYRNPTVGWMADLETMTTDKLKQWYKKWYAPNNATVVVAGDVKPEEVLALAKKYFGKLKPEKIIAPEQRPEVQQQGIKRVTVRRPAEVPYFMMLYKTPGLKQAMKEESIEDWEPYALDVLSGILSGGGSARFNSNLVRGQEIAASISSGYSMANRLEGYFLIEGMPTNGTTVEQLEQAVRAELDSLQNNLVSSEELERVKAQVVSSDVYERDSVFYQARILGSLETVGLPWSLVDEYVGHIQKVTADQVRQVAKKYFIDDLLTVAVLDPLPLEKPLRRGPPPGGPHNDVTR